MFLQPVLKITTMIFVNLLLFSSIIAIVQDMKEKIFLPCVYITNLLKVEFKKKVNGKFW